MSYNRLRGKIKEIFGTQEAFAEALGISYVSLSGRLNGKLNWKTNEIVKACKLLHIPLSEAGDYFFVEKV